MANPRNKSIVMLHLFKEISLSNNDYPRKMVVRVKARAADFCAGFYADSAFCIAESEPRRFQ